MVTQKFNHWKPQGIIETFPTAGYWTTTKGFGIVIGDSIEGLVHWGTEKWSVKARNWNDRDIKR